VSEPTTSDPAPLTPSLLRCVGYFAVFGPVFGYLTFTFLITVERADSFTDVLWFPMAALMLAIVGLPFAWFVGLAPATLVGVLYWSLRAKANTRALAATAICVLAAVIVCAFVAMLPDVEPKALLDPAAWAVVILPGILATPLCAAFTESGLRKPNPKT